MDSQQLVRRDRTTMSFYAPASRAGVRLRRPQVLAVCSYLSQEVDVFRPAAIEPRVLEELVTCASFF